MLLLVVCLLFYFDRAWRRTPTFAWSGPRLRLPLNMARSRRIDAGSWSVCRPPSRKGTNLARMAPAAESET